MSSLAIFLDGGYIDGICKEHFSSLRVDYEKLGAEIHSRIDQRSSGTLEHLRTYFYTCPPHQGNPPTPDDHRRLSGYQKFKEALSYIPRFEMREGRLRYRGDDQFGKPIFQQKQVDLMVGLDIALLSAKQEISTIALLAGDADFMPALVAAKREGVSVWLIHGPANTYNRELWREADERVELDWPFMDGVRKD